MCRLSFKKESHQRRTSRSVCRRRTSPRPRGRRAPRWKASFWVRRPHAEQFDVAVAPAVLSKGVVDVGGLADLAIHDFEPGVFEVRDPNRVDHVAHREVLWEWSFECL